MIPKGATKLAEEHSHHTGRGGGKLHRSRLFCLLQMTEHDVEGNVYHASEKEHPSDPEGLVDKLKHKIVGKKHE